MIFRLPDDKFGHFTRDVYDQRISSASREYHCFSPSFTKLLSKLLFSDFFFFFNFVTPEKRKLGYNSQKFYHSTLARISNGFFFQKDFSFVRCHRQTRAPEIINAFEIEKLTLICIFFSNSRFVF